LISERIAPPFAVHSSDREDIAEALAFAADGKVKEDTELQPLSAINRYSTGSSLEAWHRAL
jgi:hypothetical protein